MSETPHPPSDEGTFRASLTRHVAAAGVLVVCVAGAFWAVGSLGGDDTGEPVVAESEPDDGAEPPADDELSDPGPVDEGEDDEPEERALDEDADDVTEPEPDETDADETDTDETDTDETDAGAEDDADEPDADADADDGEGAEDDADEGDTAPDPPAIDRATITVQVLDGYQADGGTAANTLASELDELGYDIVARNPALRYEATTVLWSPGFEDEGQQVAREIGAAEARQQPGNLSTSVAVHVVVGADRG